MQNEQPPVQAPVFEGLPREHEEHLVKTLEAGKKPIPRHLAAYLRKIDSMMSTKPAEKNYGDR
jgi:hypothetical protein